MRAPGLAMLEGFRSTHAMVVGMGHEPEMRSRVVSRLRQLNGEFGRVVFQIAPVCQSTGATKYL
eukprot:11716239-Alexandrium_andersonii.AAC.1